MSVTRIGAVLPDGLDAGHGNEERARQVAALVWRPSASGLDVLLVTSRETRRWVLPKGWPIDGKSAADSALQEAWEEAGAIAVPADQPLGTYQYDKVLEDGTLLPCRVDVFSLPVARLADEWPEMMLRTRRWYGAEAAALLVAEPDLAVLLREFGQNVPAAVEQC